MSPPRISLSDVVQQLMDAHGIDGFVHTDAVNVDTVDAVAYVDAPYFFSSMQDIEPETLLIALESQLRLADGDLCSRDEDSFLFEMLDGQIVLSGNGVTPRSIFLLAIDSTISDLAALAQEHRLLGGTVISTDWLARAHRAVGTPSLELVPDPTTSLSWDM